ncbi:DUF1659 domain-containing protein [Sutcliffiella cohnii]
MAQAVLENTQLRLIFEVGLDEHGNVQFKTKNYNNIAIDATNEGLIAAAQAISSLQVHPLDAVKRNDLQLIVE